MKNQARWLTTPAVLLVLVLPALAAGKFLAGWGTFPSTSWPHGALALIAVWSALSNMPIYIRWACGYLLLWMVCPLLGPAFAAHDWPHWQWQRMIGCKIVPHVLLTFSVLSVLRGFGLSLHESIDGPAEEPHDLRWRFTLRKLFAWVTAAALLSLAWKQSIAIVQWAVSDWHWAPWQIAANLLSKALSLTIIDIVAVWAVLRPGTVHWRLVLLLTVVAALQALIWHYAEDALLAITLKLPWDAELLEICLYDLCYLGQLLMAILLVRSGGYRWTASQSLSP